jgi:hypothetical protein
MPMPITVQHEQANIYRLDVSGRLAKPEFDRTQESLASEIRRVGPVRLLFVLSQFEGWEQNPGWGDLGFYVAHGDSIDRIAIVGDEKWRNETMMFASADLRRAPVEYFSTENALAEARAWLLGA